MHIEIDNALIRITEQTLRELLEGVAKIKKDIPIRRTVLMKSDLTRMRFLIDINNGQRVQQALNYEIVVPNYGITSFPPKG
jgi:hypothetical protein